MNVCSRACVLALSLPLLHGCAGAMIAAQVFPTVVGGISMAGARDRSPFRIDIPSATPRTDKDLAELDAQIRQAECGDAKSQFWLASALQNDFNTTPNSIEIYKWYRLAEMRKFAPATAQLAALDATMSEADIAQARGRALAWQAMTESCAVGG